MGVYAEMRDSDDQFDGHNHLVLCRGLAPRRLHPCHLHLCLDLHSLQWSLGTCMVGSIELENVHISALMCSGVSSGLSGFLCSVFPVQLQ